MQTCAASAASRPSGIATIAVRGVISSLTGRCAKASTPDTTAISPAEASAPVSAPESTAASVVRLEGSRDGMNGASGRPSRSSHGTARATIGSAQRRPTTRGTRYATQRRVNQPADRGDVGMLEGRAQRLGQVSERDPPVHDVAVAVLADRGRGVDVVFVADLAHDLLEDVLERDQAGRPAELVDHDRQGRGAALKVAQVGGGGLTLRGRRPGAG